MRNYIARATRLALQGLVKLMEAASLPPDINTMHALLNVYADAQRPQDAEQLFSRLQSCGIQVLLSPPPPSCIVSDRSQFPLLHNGIAIKAF